MAKTDKRSWVLNAVIVVVIGLWAVFIGAYLARQRSLDGPDSNRGASIRIPIHTTTHDWKGYLEDRRPASDADPYLVVDRIMRTVKVGHEEALKVV